jgi:phosphoglycolate phosphatase
MSYGAVLFDLDGTLLDTLDDLADSMNSVLMRHGFPTHPRDAYRYHVGDGVENLVSRSLPEAYRRAGFVAQCVGAMREEYGRRWAAKTRPYEGIPELLDGLTHRGIHMAVLSNKPHDFTQAMVAELLGRWRFDVVLGVRPSIPRKPDPSAAWEIARALGVPAESFLYLGDTNTDMKTANAAGMYAVGALWGFRPAEELRASGARVLIRTPTELLGLL